MKLQKWIRTGCLAAGIRIDARRLWQWAWAHFRRDWQTAKIGQACAGSGGLWRLCFIVLSVLVWTPAWAAPGSMIKEDVIRQYPNPSAASVGRVSKGAVVEVLARQAGWTQISHAGITGWVRILSVKSSADSTGSQLGGIVQMGTARSDSRRVVAVAGLRGLSEDELRVARFNASELLRLHQFASSRADAESFARRSGLRPVEVAYIDPVRRAPERSANSFNLLGEND